MKLNKNQYDKDGFLIVNGLIDGAIIGDLHLAFQDLFSGKFETGIMPDEINWQQGKSDPSLTRQICNGWKANRTIAKIVLSEILGKYIGELTDWPGVRIMIDNVLHKPVGARSLGYHQDSAYLSWFTPNELCTCWIALDETTVQGGTIEFARGSHQWKLCEPKGEFHGPEDYQQFMRQAAINEGIEADIAYVAVPAGGGSFHHGRTWHGSGHNGGKCSRRALVLHAMRSDVEYLPANFNQGIGPIYSRYKRLNDNILDENHFPIIWSRDGYRTPGLDVYLS